jgi:hypothetical protein
MAGADTLSGAIGNILWFFGDVAFTWVPATFAAVTGTAPGVGSPLSPLSQPVSAPEALSYLQQASTPAAYAALFRDWSELVALSIILSLLFGALIIYCALRILEVRRHERKRFEAVEHSVAAHDVPKTHLRWNHVVEEATSDSEQAWRLAILEADIMLNELLDFLGYRGETMGDKMKQVDRANFRTIDLAWEAHLVRNKVAHQGSGLTLNKREVRHVIGLYEQVFREFKLIE